MSIEKTKEQLLLLLQQDDNRVIALSGRWGTGKTHLWNEVKEKSTDKRVNEALYASLFGVSNIDQVKRKLIEGALPGVALHGGIFAGFKNVVNAGVTAASTHYKALAALKDLNLLLMAPVVLRGKVIVIDDIERKHEKLGIDEVLGFIDEYSKEYDARFVLVLNDDQLASKGDQEKLWTTFREKVIDQEIRLTTTPEEAFSIAISLTPSKFAATLEKACKGCGLTNIRIVRKIVKVANQILADRDLDDAIQARVVPSIVLFSAIHYRGIEDGPDFQFALNIGNPQRVRVGADPNAKPTEEEKGEDRWRMLIYDLGINACDEFEQVLVEFLESGLFEGDRIQGIIERYVAETGAMQTQEAARAFLKKVFWDHRASDADLLAEAAQFPANAGHLDPYVATSLHEALLQIPGGQPLGQGVIDGWLAAFAGQDHQGFAHDNPFNNPLHPDIKAAFDAAEAQAHARTTVVDACIHIIESSGWGTMQEVAMRRASAAEFEAAIRTMDLETLRRFMRRMIEMRLQRGTYDVHFGTATQHFVDACRAIANDPNSPKLAALVKKLFATTALAPELNPPQAALAQAQPQPQA